MLCGLTVSHNKQNFTLPLHCNIPSLLGYSAADGCASVIKPNYRYQNYHADAYEVIRLLKNAFAICNINKLAKQLWGGLCISFAIFRQNIDKCYTTHIHRHMLEERILKEY